MRVRGRPITRQTILQAVIRLTGVPYSMIVNSRLRYANVVEARALFAAGCRDMTHASYSEIGDTVGQWHTTSIHAVKRFDRMNPCIREQKLVQLATEVRRIMIHQENHQ